MQIRFDEPLPTADQVKPPYAAQLTAPCPVSVEVPKVSPPSLPSEDELVERVARRLAEMSRGQQAVAAKGQLVMARIQAILDEEGYQLEVAPLSVGIRPKG